MRLPSASAAPTMRTTARPFAPRARAACAGVTRARSSSPGTCASGAVRSRSRSPQLCRWATSAARVRLLAPGGGVDADGARMSGEAVAAGALLIREQDIVQLPVAPLLAGAMRCQCGFHGTRMEGSNGEVYEHISDATRRDVLRVETRERFADEV